MTGAICLDILKDQWLVSYFISGYFNYFILFLLFLYPRAAAMTLRTVLLSLQSLLSSAEPDDPQDAVVAKQVEFHVANIFICL